MIMVVMAKAMVVAQVMMVVVIIDCSGGNDGDCGGYDLVFYNVFNEKKILSGGDSNKLSKKIFTIILHKPLHLNEFLFISQELPGNLDPSDFLPYLETSDLSDDLLSMFETV